MSVVALVLPFLLLSTVTSTYATSCGHSELTDADKNEVLKIHNDMRSAIAKGEFVAKTDVKPPGVDIQMLQWDCELEKSAQKYANTCPTGHSDYAKLGVGENLYWSYYSDPDVPNGEGKDASKSWADEFQQFGWQNGKFDQKMFASGIAHATQMVWAKTNKIGCGKKLCPSKQIPGFPYSIVIVCHYNPPGNYLNQEVYTAAPTCKDVRRTPPARRS